MDKTSTSSRYDEPVWYAMSAPYRNELKVQAVLRDKFSIETYIPLRCCVLTRGGRKVRRTLPAVSNLLFAHSTLRRLNEVKPFVPRMQFKTRTVGDSNRLIIVPDKQMEDFIRLTGTADDRTAYLLPEEVDLKKGTRVRILGGPLDGVEGVFVKVKGVRNRRFLVSIPGLLSAATEISPDLLEVLE